MRFSMSRIDGQILVELAPVVAAQRVLETLGIAEHEIQDALPILGLALTLCGILLVVCRAEHPLENRAGPDFRRIRSVLGPPGNAVAVGAAVAVVAVAALNAFFASQFERREPRLALEVLGGDLIHRDAGLDVLAVGLLRMDAGQIRRAGAAMVARSRRRAPGRRRR